MIYFIKSIHNARVKIGYADDVAERSKQLRLMNGGDLEVLGVCEGDRLFEASLHRQFKPDRLYGEWFKESDAISEYIRQSTTKPVGDNPDVRRDSWIKRLEAQYKEDALTLIPRLLTYYGRIEPLAQEANVSTATITRWCESHAVTRRLVYEPPKDGTHGTP